METGADQSSWIALGDGLDRVAAQPASRAVLAVNGEGQLAAAWLEHDGTSSNLYVSRWDEDLQAWSPAGAAVDLELDAKVADPQLALASARGVADEQNQFAPDRPAQQGVDVVVILSAQADALDRRDVHVRLEPGPRGGGVGADGFHAQVGNDSRLGPAQVGAGIGDVDGTDIHVGQEGGDPQNGEFQHLAGDRGRRRLLRSQPVGDRLEAGVVPQAFKGGVRLEPVGVLRSLRAVRDKLADPRLGIIDAGERLAVVEDRDQVTAVHAGTLGHGEASNDARHLRADRHQRVA